MLCDPNNFINIYIYFKITNQIKIVKKNIISTNNFYFILIYYFLWDALIACMMLSKACF